jgi:hypothetical protein
VCGERRGSDAIAIDAAQIYARARARHGRRGVFPRIACSCCRHWRRRGILSRQDAAHPGRLAARQEGACTNREIEYLAGGDLQKLVADLMQAAGPRLPEVKKIVLESYF